MREVCNFKKEDVVIISRHDAFVEFLKMKGILHGDEQVISHVSNPDVIDGKVVITSGLPMHLAAKARCVIVVSMNIPPEMRGKEMSVDDMEKFFVGIDAFKVERINTDGMEVE